MSSACSTTWTSPPPPLRKTPTRQRRAKVSGAHEIDDLDDTDNASHEMARPPACPHAASITWGDAAPGLRATTELIARRGAAPQNSEPGPARGRVLIGEWRPAPPHAARTPPRDPRPRQGPPCWPTSRKRPNGGGGPFSASGRGMQMVNVADRPRNVRRQQRRAGHGVAFAQDRSPA